MLATSTDEIDLTGTGLSYGRIPQHHDREPNVDGRRLVEAPGRSWPYAPETCPLGRWDPARQTHDTEWLAATVLVCSGCGLNVS